MTRTETKTLAAALRALAGHIESHEGVPEAALHEAAGRLEELEAQIAAARRDSAEAQALVAEAADDVASWGAYASEYFQQKHDLAGCIAKYRGAPTNALAAAIEQAVPPYREDAERWRAIRPHYCAADFCPEREDGLNLGQGVALIFLMPKGLRVSGDADQTIDAARKGGA